MSSNDDIWFYDKLYQANDSIFTEFKSNRSTCTIMFPAKYCSIDSIPDSLDFNGVNGTLINIPTLGCDSSFIMTAAHVVGAPYIDSLLNSENFRSNTIIRFNWLFKYGRPDHLKNINCYDPTNLTNFEKWRATIDFDEIIDYQGVDIFAYSSEDGYDPFILSMRCKPFFKEYHLGWSNQQIYDYYGTLNVNEYVSPTISNKVFIMGSRTGAYPKSYFTNYKVKGANIDKFYFGYPNDSVSIQGWS